MSRFAYNARETLLFYFGHQGVLLASKTHTYMCIASMFGFLIEAVRRRQWRSTPSDDDDSAAQSHANVQQLHDRYQDDGRQPLLSTLREGASTEPPRSKEGCWERFARYWDEWLREYGRYPNNPWEAGRYP